jgi:predicted acetyltransferase
MSDISVGPPENDEEIQRLVAEHRRTYVRSAEESEQWLARVNKDDLRVVRRDGKVAGGLVLLPMAQWFGGRSVPMTGIGGVGIDPDDRATGLATALMRSAVEELHGQGVALSALYPATQPVYRRVGYELAGSFVVYSAPVNTIDVRERSIDVELFDPVDIDVLKRVQTERARAGNGWLDAPERMWERMLDDRGGTDVHTYLVGGSSEPQGYVVFTQSRQEHDGWKYDLNVRDIVALTPAAARRLLTFFADHRSFANNVKWTGPIGDPLVFHMREQDWKIDWSYTWMLRIVDVERALAERGYPVGLEAELHIAVADDLLPGNDASFVLHVANGKGETSRGGRGAVKIDVRGLAPLYTGFLGAEELRATGYVDGPDEDLAIATAIFGGPAPSLNHFF